MSNPYLKAMDIDVWTLRSEGSSQLPACYAYELIHNDRTVGMLFAAAIMQDDAVDTLLQKMMTALKCQWRGEWFPQQPDCSELNDLRFIVVLGEGFDLKGFSAPVIRSYAPQQLIADPHLKSETWKSLQEVFTYLG